MLDLKVYIKDNENQWIVEFDPFEESIDNIRVVNEHFQDPVFIDVDGLYIVSGSKEPNIIVTSLYDDLLDAAIEEYKEVCVSFIDFIEEYKKNEISEAMDV